MLVSLVVAKFPSLNFCPPTSLSLEEQRQQQIATMSPPSTCLDRPTVQVWSHQRVDHLREVAGDRHEESPARVRHQPIQLRFLLHQRVEDLVFFYDDNCCFSSSFTFCSLISLHFHLRENRSQCSSTIEPSACPSSPHISTSLRVRPSPGGRRHLHQFSLQVRASLPVLPGAGGPPRAHLPTERA